MDRLRCCSWWSRLRITNNGACPLEGLESLQPSRLTLFGPLSTREPSRVSLHPNVLHIQHVCSLDDPGGLLSIRILRVPVVGDLGLEYPQEVDHSPLWTDSVKQLGRLYESMEDLSEEVIYVIVEFLQAAFINSTIAEYSGELGKPSIEVSLDW